VTQHVYSLQVALALAVTLFVALAVHGWAIWAKRNPSASAQQSLLPSPAPSPSSALSLSLSPSPHPPAEGLHGVCVASTGADADAKPLLPQPPPPPPLQSGKPENQDGVPMACSAPAPTPPTSRGPENEGVIPRTGRVAAMAGRTVPAPKAVLHATDPVCVVGEDSACKPPIPGTARRAVPRPAVLSSTVIWCGAS
jgi:hypothetical protein